MKNHEPESWFWEAGSERCPHGPEPDNGTAAWDTWSDRHTGSPQDIFVCLDAPMGDHCPACFEENGGDPVPWTDCQADGEG